MRHQGTSRRRPAPGGRTDGVSIASGAQIQRIDLDALLRPPASPDSTNGGVTVNPAEGTAMPGGGVREPPKARPTAPAQTIALADGTRITFASAHDLLPVDPC